MNTDKNEPLEKTTYKEIAVYRSFTTERRPRPRTTINLNHKGSVVKEKCRQLTEIALNLFPEAKITQNDLVYLLTRYVGGDKNTIRAYTGYRGRIVVGKRGGNNHICGIPRDGYLEEFGFMHRQTPYFWNITYQSTLEAPNLGFNPQDESSKQSIDKISLSLTDHSLEET